VAVGAGLLLARGGDDASAASTEAKTTTTAEVQRRNLVVRETFDGTLGYSDTRPLSGAGQGTITKLPAEGSTVLRGQPLYVVDGRAVRLLYGAEPLYRRLAAGIADGPDVRQLEANLAVLGYDTGAVDDHFDSSTTAALKRWQDAIGVAETGALELRDAVFLPGPRRIGSVTAVVGSSLQPGSEVLETTSTKAVVTVDLDARRQDLVHKGDAVQVELPSGRTVNGRITSVGTVAVAAASSDPGQESTPTITVEISVAGVHGLDGAPVDVGLATEKKRGALAVPVEALLALRGGGYAVEVDRGGARSLVAVRTGTFADGWVEVEGADLRPGTQVVTPA
jgi:peptidoglycan hydrolase-like protein with peptidoglycan-binding domain